MISLPAGEGYGNIRMQSDQVSRHVAQMENDECPGYDKIHVQYG